MKIKLINPPSPFLLDEKVFPSLGLLSVGTALKKHADVEIIDLTGEKDLESKLDEHLKFDDIFGITATSAQFNIATKINNYIKKIRPNATTILGGAHANCITEEIGKSLYRSDNLKDLDTFDYIVRGEVENNPIKLIKNIGTLISSKYIDLGLADLKTTPIPDRSMIDIDSYKFQLDGKKGTTILTQRGCPFRCDFCSGRETEMYGKVRQRSPEQIVEEMDYLNSDFGFESFQWFDDEVNVNPSRLKRLAELLKDKNYKHRGFIRSDLMLKHPESLDYLEQIGFVELCAGVESGSDRILKLIGKNTTYADNAKVARMIMDRGIRFKAFAMVGHPSETKKDLEMTYKWMEDVKPTSHDAAIMTPYPGSKLYDQAKRSKIFKGYDWSYKGLYFNKPRFSQESPFHKGTPGQYHSYVRTKKLTGDDILKARIKLENIK